MDVVQPIAQKFTVQQMAPVTGLPIPEEGHLLKTEAAIRNNFTVDILKMNGEDFRAESSEAMP